MTDNKESKRDDNFQEPPHTGGGLIYDSKEKIMGALHYTQQAAYSLGEKVGILSPYPEQGPSDIGNSTAVVHSAINKGSDGEREFGGVGNRVGEYRGGYEPAQDDTGNVTHGHRRGYVFRKSQDYTGDVKEMDLEKPQVGEYKAPLDSFGNVLKDPQSESIRTEIPHHNTDNLRVYKTSQDDTGNITESILNKAQDTASYLKEKVQDSADYLRQLSQPQLPSDPTTIDPVYDNPRTNSNGEYLKEKAQDTANYIKDKAQGTVNYIKVKVEERYGNQNVTEEDKKPEIIE